MAVTTASSGWKRDFTVIVAPNEPDRQAAPECTARRLAAPSAIQARPQYVQLRFAHCPFQPQQQAVVEQRRMIKAISIADEGVAGAPARSIRRCQSALFRARRETSKAQYEADMAERHFGNEPCKSRANDSTRTGETEVFINDNDPIVGPADLARPDRECVLSFCGFTIVFHLMWT